MNGTGCCVSRSVPRFSSSRLEDPHIDERSNKKRVGFSGMTGSIDESWDGCFPPGNYIPVN